MAERKVNVAVVIPNWNGIDLIRECLDALRKQTQSHNLIVVDNGSHDGSNKLIRKEYPEAWLLEFPDNAGFAGGVNRGIRPAIEQGAEYIALLNNDAVADPRWLEHLVAAAVSEPKAGAVAAKILTQDGARLDSTGDFYSVWGFSFPRGRGEEDRGQYDGARQREIFAASGGASLYRSAMLESVGLFDERFFAYFEDVDLGFRMRLDGWKVLYEAKAEVRHYIGASSSRMDAHKKTGVAGKPQASATGHERPSKFARFHTVKNFTYLYTKNMPGWLYWKYLPLFWASWWMMLISDAKRGLLGSNFAANWESWGNLGAVLGDRRRIQSGRRVKPAQVDKWLYHELPPLQRLRFERWGLARRAK